MSEIRYNHLDDSYVIIAPERLHRPDTMAWSEEAERGGVCPFCEGNEALTPDELYALREEGSAANRAPWQTRVVPNLYRAVQIETPNRSHGEGLYSMWEGFGAHEVIIDTPRHHGMGSWEPQEFYRWLLTLQHRLHDLRGDVRIHHIALFKNHGAAAGASQSHPHTQLIGLGVVPRAAVRFLERTIAHYREHGRGILEDLIAQEEHEGSRIVISDDAFVAYCPYASAYPFEVIVASRRPCASLETLDKDALQRLAGVMQTLFGKMTAQLGDFDFNLNLSNPPMHPGFDTAHLHEQIPDACRFHIRITPRIYRHGGFELGTGTMINPVSPEQSAELLRGEERG